MTILFARDTGALTRWKILAASDFSVGVWMPRGLMTCYVLFVSDIENRVVHVASVTRQPDETWMLQIRRNLIDGQYDGLAGKKYLRRFPAGAA